MKKLQREGGTCSEQEDIVTKNICCEVTTGCCILLHLQNTDCNIAVNKRIKDMFWVLLSVKALCK